LAPKKRIVAVETVSYQELFQLYVKPTRFELYSRTKS